MSHESKKIALNNRLKRAAFRHAAWVWQMARIVFFPVIMNRTYA